MSREGPTRPPFPVGGEDYPSLVYNHGGGCQTICRISEEDEVCSESKNIPELSDKKVIFCTIDGRWLLLLHATNNKEEEVKLSIWNPTTQESIALPRVMVTEDVVFEYIDKGQALFTSSSPKDPNFMVFLFLGVIPSLLYCRVGDPNWREFKYAETIEAQRPSLLHVHQCCVFQHHQLNRHRLHTCTQLLHQPVCFNAKIYALSSCSIDVVQINVDGEFKVCSLNVLVSNPLPPYGRVGVARTNFLVSWPDLGIFLIDIFSPSSPNLKSLQAPQIKILKFNFPTKTWLRMICLNKVAIFLGTRYSLLCNWGSSYPNKWSGVYFASDYNKRILLSYRVEDGTITSYSAGPTANLPEEPPQWIMPVEDPLLWIKPVENVEELPQCIMPVEDVKQPPQQRQRMLTEKRGSSAGMMVEEQGHSSFSKLPLELLSLIYENHLYSFPSYIRFPLINKSCATSRIGITRKNPFHPCLIYSDYNNGVYHITDSTLSHKLSVKIPQVLEGKVISCSRDGWLLLTGYGFLPDSESDCLFNPFTEQIVQTVGYRYGRLNFGISNFTFLGKPSSSSPENCFVLAMSLCSSRRGSQLESGNPPIVGKAEWWTLVVGALHQPVEFIPSSISPVFCRERWYYLGHNGRLGILRFIDMKERRFVWKVETHECPCENYTRSYLSECGGELVSVFIADSDQESWVRVFKLGHKKWEEIDSLRSYTLYLGWSSSMACHAQTPDMSDRIYFPRFYKGGLVYYSLKTKKYYSIGSDKDEELKSFHGTTMYSDCAWIIPEIVGSTRHLSSSQNQDFLICRCRMVFKKDLQLGEILLGLHCI